MKHSPILFASLALFVISTGIHAATPTASQIRREQESLREEFRKAEAEYGGLVQEKNPPHAVTEGLVPLYEGFQKEAALLEAIPGVPESVTGSSLIWSKPVRTIPLPIPAAQAFLCAPGDSVVPFSGEFVRSVADVTLPERGGIGFAFTRTYASFSSTDYGLGPGWDSNWNVTLQSEGEETLVLHYQGRDIRFTLLNGSWMPESGVFLRLDISGDKATVTRSDLSRLEFEPAAEQGGEGRRWRLAAIASRHGGWTVNRLEVAYLDGCDRIHFVTDPFGQRIDFSYDNSGHLVQMTAPHDFVQFVYDGEAGTLVQAVYPRWMNKLAMAVKSGVDYAYDGQRRLVRETPTGSPSLVASYDESGRVVSCALEAGGQSQFWAIQYAEGETIVHGPAPEPETRYRFGKAPHPSLPDGISIPARKAETKYAYNADFLIAEETDAIGAKTSYAYDSGNPNPIHRGNQLSMRRTPAPDFPADWREIGVETVYHSDIAAIVKEVTYQVDKDGTRTNVKTETFEYDRKDLMPIRHEDGGIVSRTIFNRYGNPIAEVDATNHCTLFYYSEKLPEKADYALSPGSPNGGGLLVEQVEDADAKQIQASCAAVGAKPPRYGDAKVTRPVSRRTLFALDARGNVIREQCGYADTLYFRNSQGSIVAESDAQTGTRIHEYLPSGKNSCLFTEFVPCSDAAFEGEKVHPFVGRRFVKETFKYDALLQLSEHSPTEESSRDGIPRLRYERYPNGRVRRFRNSSGLCREDIVDAETGFLHAQKMVDEGNEALLATDLQYYPNGQLRSGVDVYGGKTEYRLDGFGNVRSTVLPIGRVDTRIVDALGRVLEEASKDSAGNVLSKTTYFYDNPYGLLSKTEAWAGSNAAEVVSEILYDGNGRKVAERGAHADSWRHTLYDGLGRVLAVREPSGDCSVTLYRHDREVYSRSVMLGTSLAQTTKSSGFLSELDDLGRVVRRVPVDSKGKAANEREEFFSYDAIGQTIRTETALLVTETDYDSQGRAIRVRTTPKKTDQGERPVLTSTEYLADGRVVRKMVGNTALALVGTKDNVEPKLIEAPQENKTEYDGLGRLVRTIQPDGLTVTTEYNGHSLPTRMTWTHPSEQKALRSLTFSYSDMGQVLSISNALSGSVLRECEYDLFGRCIHSTDLGAEDTVELRTAFDAMGRVAESGVSLNGRDLPSQTFCYDAGMGIMEQNWKGLSRPNKFHYWGSETYEQDGTGRLRKLSLDGERFATWEYLGSAVEMREVRSSGLLTKWTYNDFWEPVSQRILRGDETFGTLEYAYGPQGQAEYSSTRLKGKLGKEYTYATYSGFDSYRRLTAQNGETAVPDVSGRDKRRTQVFGKHGDSLQALETTRMAYDQTDSLWVRYTGELSDSFAASAFRRNQTPVYVSAARVQLELRQPPPRELASNRETTTAFWHCDNDVDRLTAEEDVFDSLGNLVEFNGTYWNGQRKFPATWTLEYDPLGRLVKMTAKAREDVLWVAKGDQIAVLRFAYDSRNRRIRKTVEDRTDRGRAATSLKTTLTVYSGNEQRLVLENSDEGGFRLLEEYLWASGSRELLMSAMPESRAEKEKATKSNRYYFQQDRNLNVVLVTKNGDNGLETVSTASYLGFGENATRATVERVSCDNRLGQNSISQSLDGFSDRWHPLQEGLHYLQLDLEEESPLSQLNIWTADLFPKTFAVFVLPVREKTPATAGNLAEWVNTYQKEFCVAVSQNGIYQEITKRLEWDDPYRINLGGLKGKHIAIVWYGRDTPQGGIEVREFEVVKALDNPSAIAFAGQWLDRETDLYYQINRYRKAGAEKFISPDPLGFLDGPNMYAYAHANPLEWHDPDGRLPTLLVQAGIGAAIGAIIGGGGYALRCWLTGEEFSWREFGIQTFIGAASGAIAGLTMGLFNPWEGQVCASIAQAAWHGAARGAVSGFAAGAFSGGANPFIHGVLNGDDAWDIARNTAKGAGIGALSGATIGAALGAASGAYAQWNLQRSENGCVWRVCRPDEDPSKGLIPKNMADTKPLNSHVTHGEYQSRFISTTKDYKTAVKWAQQNPGTKIVKINTTKLSNNIFDLTDEAVRNQHLKGRWSLNWSKASQEVVIEGPIGPKAITEAKFLVFYF